MVGLKKQSIKIKSLVLVFAASLCLFSHTSAQSTFSIQSPNSSLSPLTLTQPSLLNLDLSKEESSVMYKLDYNKVYHDGLGFFCKMENSASFNSPVQLRMRLGSLEYVDALEQKLPAYRVPETTTK